ncbi:GTPase, partial ['Camptotheca acuminata' phytoplasma]|uniref:GTPase n=1 Tax='Camptotheca acuminata' phytoplasma TaxID=3239192 RepID=UPI00351A8F71
MFKSGFITIMGRVNVGKSTLLNFLVETKISIVSNKPNTTKEKILGVCNGSNYQFVFVDNPGLIYKNFKKLFMPKFNSVLLKNIDEVDVILFLVDSECRIEDKYFLNFLK